MAPAARRRISHVHLFILPPELYLREFLELDARDPEAVLAFCRQWGPVGRFDCSDLANLPFSGRYAQDADNALPLPWAPRWKRMDAERLQRAVRRLGFRGLIGVHSVARVQVYQDTLSDLLLLWRFASGEISGDELAEQARPEERPYLSLSREQLRSVSVGRAEYDLVPQLNLALTPFHVRLELHLSDLAPLGTPLPNVYEVACLQLANHIAERASYRHCANETCGRLFVRQRGGSKIANMRGQEHGQYHSTGVMYCTPQCARAQAARALRRRKREDRAGEAG